MPKNTRDRAIEALMLSDDGGGRELAEGVIDAITEHVVETVRDENLPELLRGMGPTPKAGPFEITHPAPAPMLVGAPDLKDVEDIITAAGCSATKTEAMMHLIENFRATALADELRRLVEARMPTLGEVIDAISSHDRAYGAARVLELYRDRLLGDAAEGGD